MLGLLDGVACLLVIEMMGYESESYDFAAAIGTQPAYSFFIDLNEACQSGKRAMFVSLDGGRTRDMTKDHGVRHGTMDKAERYG